MSLTVDLRLQRGAFHLSANAALPRRGVTILFGASGAGKSTLLRAMAGLAPSRGLIRFGDTLWQDEQHSLPAHQRPVGLMLQKPTLFPHLDVAGNLRFAARRAGADQALWRRVVGRLELGGLLRRSVRELSGGEASRVALGRTLLSDPQLLLLDEPLAALDQARRQALMTVISEIAERIPVLYVTHQLDEVITLGEHLWWLEEGRLRAQGTLADALAGPDSPLAQHQDAAVVLRTREVAFHREHHLLELRIGEQSLRIPATGPRGEAPRLRVAARDVSLSLSAAEDSSVLNILPASVESVRDLGQGQCLVRLLCEQQWLLARVTRYSCERLALAPGVGVFAQIKAAALV
ncbi:molybdenum ABC transporter ATP-binding protein [Alloalcanivorax mobilis]|uniref:molybdenum ABC transporter ATP-binding protein n=1 Tax=Alloalcanivorax mobilis TaxID=2019569 RepID=UPI000C795542|nr:molybdenum ABC transporter ATP-binding protein [Alloalcanivorax mobilis]